MSSRNNQKRTLNRDMATCPSPSLLLCVAMLLAFPIEEASAFSKTMGFIDASSRNPTTTPRLGRLNYRNGDGVDTEPTATANKWWGGLKPATPKSEEEQVSERVDEYLKFLDKRNRQHYHSDVAPQNIALPRNSQESRKSPSPVMRWLNKEDNSESDTSNAFFALDIAARATKALNEQSMKTTVGQRVLANSSLETAVLSFKKSEMYLRLVRSRRALLRYQTAKVRQLLSKVLYVTGSALKKIPEAPAMLIKAGGGTKPLTVAFGILSVVFIHVVFPAVVSFLTESLASQA